MERRIEHTAVSGSITPPCSKSYAQRAFAAALLTEGDSVISNLELCDDTLSAMRVIADLGANVVCNDPSTYTITGGINPRTDTIHIGESGLSTRLFTPIAALCDRPITIKGSGSMLSRPIGMMIEPLENLGVQVESDGFLPLTVCGPMHGGESDVDGYVSSQFLTGLLMSLPVCRHDTVLHINHLQSIPYINMTIDTASRFGIRITHNDYRDFYIEGGQSYCPTDMRIEGDWSAAAFMLVAGAVAGNITLTDMNPLSLQADVAIIRALERAGAGIVTSATEVSVCSRPLHSFEFDATNCPDLFPILAVLAANCTGTTCLTGVKRLIHKESNRAQAISTEFAKLGIQIHIDDDRMFVTGGPIHSGEVESWNDHRIAMAAAIAALTCDSAVTIHQAEAVSKSYPSFWNDLNSIVVK